MVIRGFLAADMLADKHEHTAAVEEVARDVDDDKEEQENDNNNYHDDC